MASTTATAPVTVKVAAEGPSNKAASAGKSSGPKPHVERTKRPSALPANPSTDALIAKCRGSVSTITALASGILSKNIILVKPECMAVKRQGDLYEVFRENKNCTYSPAAKELIGGELKLRLMSKRDQRGVLEGVREAIEEYAVKAEGEVMEEEKNRQQEERQQTEEETCGVRGDTRAAPSLSIRMTKVTEEEDSSKETCHYYLCIGNTPITYLSKLPASNQPMTLYFSGESFPLFAAMSPLVIGEDNVATTNPMPDNKIELALRVAKTGRYQTYAVSFQILPPSIKERCKFNAAGMRLFISHKMKGCDMESHIIASKIVPPKSKSDASSTSSSDEEEYEEEAIRLAKRKRRMQLINACAGLETPSLPPPETAASAAPIEKEQEEEEEAMSVEVVEKKKKPAKDSKKGSSGKETAADKKEKKTKKSSSSSRSKKTADEDNATSADSKPKKPSKKKQQQQKSAEAPAEEMEVEVMTEREEYPEDYRPPTPSVRSNFLSSNLSDEDSEDEYEDVVTPPKKKMRVISE